MAASTAFWAYGSQLQLSDGAVGGTYTAIAEITELTPPNMSRDAQEVTHHASPDGYKEFIGTFRDGGEVAVKANWLPTNATQDGTTGVLEAFNDNDMHYWKIILPNTLITISFAGIITAFNPDLPLSEQGTLSFTVKVSGKPTVS